MATLRASIRHTYLATRNAGGPRQGWRPHLGALRGPGQSLALLRPFLRRRAPAHPPSRAMLIHFRRITSSDPVSAEHRRVNNMLLRCLIFVLLTACRAPKALPALFAIENPQNMSSPTAQGHRRRRAPSAGAARAHVMSSPFASSATCAFTRSATGSTFNRGTMLRPPSPASSRAPPAARSRPR